MEKDIHDLILRSLIGEAAEDEMDVLHQWLKADRAHAAEYEQLQRSWKTRLPYRQFANGEEEFDKIWQRAYPEFRKARPAPMHRTSRIEIYVKMAAAFLVLLTVGFLVYQYGDQDDEGQFPKTVSKHTSAGQKSKIFLEDGTQIWLNSASEVAYPETFLNRDQRLLRLRGEAYFSVAKNHAKPFLVECQGMTVQVLGTEFSIDAGRSDRLSVALVEGSVFVEWQNEEGGAKHATLSPGEMITIRADGIAIVTENFDAKAAYGWKNGVLYFMDATLEEVVRELESWYGVDIRVLGHPDAPWQYSGEFDNYVLENVLLAMSFAEEFDFELNGDTVNIMFN